MQKQDLKSFVRVLAIWLLIAIPIELIYEVISYRQITSPHFISGVIKMLVEFPILWIVLAWRKY